MLHIDVLPKLLIMSTSLCIDLQKLSVSRRGCKTGPRSKEKHQGSSAMLGQRGEHAWPFYVATLPALEAYKRPVP